MNNYKRSWQENLVFATDIFIAAFSYIAAYFIRFEGLPPEQYLNMMIKMLPLILVIRLAAMFYFKLHKSIRKYASIQDLTQIIKAVSLSSVFIVAIAMTLQMGHPRSVFIIDWLLLLIGLSGVRFVIRITRPIRWRLRNNVGRRKKVLIVGAGDAGEMILREMIYHYGNNYEVVGLIDDDPQKYKKYIHGIAVLGTRKDISDIVRKKNIEEIVIAIPSLKADQMRDMVNYCIKSGAKYRTVPNISDVMDGRVKVKELREIRIEDLLGRDEVFLDRHKIAHYLKGKNVLITGAGGSIGSELCRQVARLSPQKLILFGKSESALVYMDTELNQFFPAVSRVPVVGDILDRKRVREVFSQHRPQIIFHAAAYKHVPLLEFNPIEAIKNNVLGTKVLAEEAIRFGVEKFIMLSTDKAVDPTSIMGVSKRITEMYITVLSGENGTKFMAVRFGNVLGSEGSVIPIFKKQIERGGPITVTHPDIRRYVMTIPEAAGLVMEAGFMGNGGEIFILEMGRQIKIVELAQDLIKLSGLEPGKDIEIVFTGLRPGEKMHEALISSDEKLFATSHGNVKVVQSQSDNGGNIFADIEVLEKLVEKGETAALIEKLKEIVPSYKPSPQVLQTPPKDTYEHRL